MASANAVHIPTPLIERVDETMESEGGYTTRAEFIREAIRRYCAHLDSLRKQNDKPLEGGRKKRGWP